jgi:hypothetical protein
VKEGQWEIVYAKDSTLLNNYYQFTGKQSAAMVVVAKKGSSL